MIEKMMERWNQQGMIEKIDEIKEWDKEWENMIDEIKD